MLLCTADFGICAGTNQNVIWKNDKSGKNGLPVYEKEASGVFCYIKKTLLRRESYPQGKDGGSRKVGSRSRDDGSIQKPQVLPGLTPPSAAENIMGGSTTNDAGMLYNKNNPNKMTKNGIDLGVFAYNYDKGQNNKLLYETDIGNIKSLKQEGQLTIEEAYDILKFTQKENISSGRDTENYFSAGSFGFFRNKI
ncbi:MAG: hypothetical protein VB082_10720 [Christensenella sp.]|nr:hypothetical protein [Christensenella sp.]